MGGEGAVADVFEAVDGVGVGVDGDEGAVVECVADLAPVDVEAAGVGVEFDGDVVADAGVDYAPVVDGVAGAAEEEAAGHVAEDGGVGVVEGFEDAGDCLVLAHF